jgi:hypothetical protein
MDFDSGPGSGGDVYYYRPFVNYNFQPIRSEVDRTVGWHHWEITSTANSTTLAIDGRVYSAASGMPFDRIILTLSAPNWRPTVTTNFDDFVFDSGPAVTQVVVGDGTAQRSKVGQLKVVFDELMTYAGVPTSAFTLQKMIGGVPNGSVSLSVNTVTVGNHSEATLTFLSDTAFGSLTDGRYRLIVHANQIRNAGGVFMAADHSNAFHRLYGDATGDARVDVADLGLFAGTYLKSSSDAGYLAYFDANNDGRVDVSDLGTFAARYLTTLP